MIKELKRINKKLRLRDLVKVISGDFKGKIGNIISVTKNSAVLDTFEKREKLIKIKGSNKTELKTIYPSVHLSNLMIIDPTINNSPSKIGIKFINNEKKRYFKKSGNLVETLSKERKNNE
jgi:ribosomal protein L24